MPCKRFEKCVQMQLDCCAFCVAVAIFWPPNAIWWPHIFAGLGHAPKNICLVLWNPHTINHGLALLGTNIKIPKKKETLETICPPHVSIEIYIQMFRVRLGKCSGTRKLFPPITEYSVRLSVIQYLWLHLWRKIIRSDINFSSKSQKSYHIAKEDFRKTCWKCLYSWWVTSVTLFL